MPPPLTATTPPFTGNTLSILGCSLFLTIGIIIFLLSFIPVSEKVKAAPKQSDDDLVRLANQSETDQKRTKEQQQLPSELAEKAVELGQQLDKLKTETYSIRRQAQEAIDRIKEDERRLATVHGIDVTADQEKKNKSSIVEPLVMLEQTVLLPSGERIKFTYFKEDGRIADAGGPKDLKSTFENKAVTDMLVKAKARLKNAPVVYSAADDDWDD